MKTTFEEKLAVAATNTKLNARKALKHPITSILSLCVFAGIAATVASFSQTNDKAIAPTTLVAPAAQTLPVARTLTSTDGRTIDVTILSKSDTAIKAKKADGKEFEIALDKLSDTDKTFVAGLVSPPVKKYKVLLINNHGPESAAIKEADMELDLPIIEGDTNPNHINLNNITDQDLKKYDLIWLAWTNQTNSDSFLNLLKRYKGVIALSAFRKTTVNDFFNKKECKLPITKAYVRSENNIIFHSKFNLKNKNIEEDPTNEGAVIKEFLKLRLAYHN